MITDKMPECPVCGAETNDFYVSEHDEIIGCPDCVRRIDAWERTREEELSAKMDYALDRWKEKQMGLD